MEWPAWLARQGQVAKSALAAHVHVPDDTIGTLAKLLRDSISLVNNKILVEDLEDLAPLKIGHAGRVGSAVVRAQGGNERGVVDVRERACSRALAVLDS